MICANGEKRWLIIEVNAMHLEANAGMVVFSTRLIDAAKEGEEKRCKILQETHAAVENSNKAKSYFLAYEP